MVNNKVSIFKWFVVYFSICCGVVSIMIECFEELSTLFFVIVADGLFMLTNYALYLSRNQTSFLMH